MGGTYTNGFKENALLYARVCLILLGAVIVGTSIQNGQYFAHGYFLHFLPVLLVCIAAFAVLRPERPAKLGLVFWHLATAIVVGAGLEVIFEIYKHHPFDENGVITLLSVCQLLVIAFVSLAVWKERNGPGPVKWKDKTLIWLIMGVGFLFLALDEKVLIHEGLDRTFHKLMHMHQTAWTSRIDDFLIGVYGFIGMGVMWFYLSEIRRFKRYMVLIGVGFVALFISVAADASSSRLDFFIWLVGEQHAHVFWLVAEVVEEGSKVFAEAFFLTGFASALREVRGFVPVPASTMAGSKVEEGQGNGKQIV